MLSFTPVLSVFVFLQAKYFSLKDRQITVFFPSLHRSHSNKKSHMMLAWWGWASNKHKSCYCAITTQTFLCFCLTSFSTLFSTLATVAIVTRLTRAQSLTSRKCGAFLVNESFRVGWGVFTAGGKPLRHSDKGVFHIFTTVGILFQCYFTGTTGALLCSGLSYV